MFKGFTSSSQSDLSPRQELELAKLNLKSARKASDPKLAFVLCNSAGDALSKIPRSISPKDTEDHPKHEEVATAYSELGELFNELGQSDKAQANYKKAEKWGTKNTVTVGNPTLLSGEPGSERDIDLIPQDIFAENMRPPGLSFRPPEPNGRLNDTPQLACCLSLLQASHSFEEIQEPLTRNWLQETQKDMDEQERLKRLATDVIREFSRDELKDSMAVSEVVYLAPVLEKDVFRSLLKQFYSGIERSELLDYHQLEGLAQLIQGAGSAYLDADDLVKILQLLSARLRDTHKQSPHYIYQLTLTVSRVLDAMADTKVKGLDREKLHEPLSLYLEGLKRSSDPYLVFQAAYAYQALQYVPDNETLWQATLRRSGKVIQGVSGLVSAVKGLDLNGFIDGLVNIQQGLGGASSAFQFVKSTYRDVTSLAESGMGFLDCMKEGLSFECKRSWYPALRGADTLIREGHLAKFKKLVCEAPCRLDPAFQWGVCQLLRDVAANAMWDADTRQGAVVFLGEIYRNDTAWGQQASIKQWILDILMQLSTFSRGDMECVETLLRVLESDGDAKKQELYQLCRVNGPSPHAFKPALPLMAFPTLIDRVQHRPDVEGSIRQLRRQRLKERGHSVYIPPQAKANLQAPDETRFPLMDRVHNFLSSDQKVFLLLGDSGSGKSTFSRALESDLWDAYNKDSSIPLYISLPTIEKPEHDMIEKHLRRTSFTEAQIKELKLYRKFVLICDGYDETQQSYNLYMRNRLNQPGEWSVQMVVSCRSEQVGADYRDRFQPVDRNRRQGSGLFQEAVMTPFSIDQIQDYIKEYVSTYQPLWKTEDYLQTLDLVPSLKDLVKNPFLLTLSLEVLPRMVDPGQTLSASLVTRVTLYDQFVEQWLERGKKRLGEKELSFQARSAFDSLSDEGFAQNGIDFLKRLAVAIYKEQNGQPVVEYSRFKDEGTWKEAFFSRDNDEKQLLREACPLTRSGNQYRFVHRSILEYGMARAIFDPQDRDRKTEPPQLSDRRKSVSSDWSFESRDSSEEVTTETEPSFLDTSSPLVWKNIVDEPSILQFLSERVQQQPVFRKQLLIYIEYSKSDASWRTAAANAITILVRGGVRFNGADLKGIHVPGADLSHGFFDSADLQEADLRKVKLNLQPEQNTHDRDTFW
ncbi:hypothetical protein BGX31_009775 [Mortierella sp. GBA43]|nr:hypothetical protein BGX31_009775 [Mortierella sp. GBA43]